MLRDSLRIGRLGQNTLLGTGGLVIRALIQAGYLLVLSRSLGVGGYGLFAGSVAVAILVAPLAGWGSALLLTRHISGDRTSSRGMWATALQQTVWTGALLILIVLGASLLLGERLGIGTIFLLALSELILLPVAQMAASQCFALERGLGASVTLCLVPASRLLAVLTLLTSTGRATPELVSIGHFAGSLIGATLAVVLIAWLDGWPDWRSRLGWRRASRQGTAYAIGRLMGTSYLEVDKVMMLQILGAVVVGSYTVGFRVLSVLALPVYALIAAAMPRLMAQHEHRGQVHTHRAVLQAAITYGVAASVVALLMAPWIPALFGPGYESTTRIVAMLSPWLLFFAVHQALAARLTACDRQSTRVLIEGGGLLLVVVLNAALLPRLGPSGAVVGLLVAELLMVLGFWISLMPRDDGLLR